MMLFGLKKQFFSQLKPFLMRFAFIDVVFCARATLNKDGSFIYWQWENVFLLFSSKNYYINLN